MVWASLLSFLDFQVRLAGVICRLGEVGAGCWWVERLLVGCGKLCCMDEEEAPPGCDLSCCGSRVEGGWGGSEMGCGREPMCVQILRVGEMVDQGVCVKHSGMVSGETRLAF